MKTFPKFKEVVMLLTYLFSNTSLSHFNRDCCFKRLSKTQSSISMEYNIELTTCNVHLCNVHGGLFQYSRYSFQYINGLLFSSIVNNSQSWKHSEILFWAYIVCLIHILLENIVWVVISHCYSKLYLISH